MIGEAYVGPMSMNLRQDLSSRSPVTAVVTHGEKLDILQTRRRFLRVRNAKGIVGWVDGRQLLTPMQMKELLATAERAAGLPSQGMATVFEPLNVHTEPNRLAPSFTQIAEGVSVEVIGHRITPRAPLRPPGQPVAPKAASRPRKLPKTGENGLSRTRFELDLPKPPPPPPDWLDLSRTPAIPEPGRPPDVTNAPPAQKLDDWSLVRLKDGKAGWVLTRLLFMSIPDDVAQYAEGHRITSYFSIGEVRDGEQVKHHWLWTTLSKPFQPYQFDSFRIFIYNVRRHRYETAYIERNLIGYSPVNVAPLPGPTGGPVPKTVAFSLIVEDKSGIVLRKTYSFEGYRVRMIRKEPHERPKDVLPVSSGGTAAVPEVETAEPENWRNQIQKSFENLLKKLPGNWPGGHRSP